jgi:hypothetical protein
VGSAQGGRRLFPPFPAAPMAAATLHAHVCVSSGCAIGGQAMSSFFKIITMLSAIWHANKENQNKLCVCTCVMLQIDGMG